jgi:phenylacetate-CoA ligase
MLFFYNPLDHFIEINDESEVVITIINYKVLSPRLRYNIEDEGKVLEYNSFVKILLECGYTRRQIQEVSKQNPIKMPILMIYGRKDGTISYMGANIYPQDVEQGLYSSKYADQIENFMITLHQGDNLESKPVINIELKTAINSEQSALIKADLAARVVDYMTKVNKDFAESIAEDSSSAEIQIEFFLPNQGPFAQRDNKKIKNKYLLKN